MNKPLVTVICLCYNHERFVREAIESVILQSYEPVQIIVTDDASTDGSQRIIQELKERYPLLELMLLQDNVGNCKAFNKAYQLAKGTYVIDFSTDDFMAHDRIERQVAHMEKAGDLTGVVFTDAIYVNEQGEFIRNHFDHLIKKKLITRVAHGSIYREILASYFIPTPSMMMRRAVLDELGGYDETLSYEDFDLLVRSSKLFEYGFINEKLTYIRKVSNSMSSRQYLQDDSQLYSTYLVCRKAQQLNADKGDELALVKRVSFELRQAVLAGKFEEANLFYQLLRDLNGVSVSDAMVSLLGRARINLSLLLKWYHQVRYD